MPKPNLPDSDVQALNGVLDGSFIHGLNNEKLKFLLASLLGRLWDQALKINDLEKQIKNIEQRFR